jgi:mannose-6-phosphate isomerase-like protein (cupin superfamily)
VSEDYTPQTDNRRQVFDVFAEIATLPSDSESMLADEYFSDLPSASSRIFRIYRTLPLHYHEHCSEHLYVVAGEGIFHLDGQENRAVPGTFLRFAQRKVHGFPQIDVHPFVVLAIDVPRRRPDDIVFIDPEDGDAATFMARNN